MDYYKEPKIDVFTYMRGTTFVWVPIGVMVVIAFGSYWNIARKREDHVAIYSKDSSKLNSRQLRKREEHEQIIQNFDDVLDRLQHKLQDDYQAQVTELQDFVKKRDRK